MLLRRVYHEQESRHHRILDKNEKLVLEPAALINKKVISSDFQEIGNVVSADTDSLTILRGVDNHYVIPKSRVQTSNGQGMQVNFRFNDLLLVELASLSYID